VTTDTPRLSTLETGLPMLTQPYTFIRDRAERFRTDVFRGGLLGRSLLFITGAEAAEVFYDTERFERADVMPGIVRKTLFGEGGVHGLDDAAHRARKAAFLSLMTKADIARFLEVAQAEWNRAVKLWEEQPRVVLLEEAREVFCRAACRWAGVPLAESDAKALARDCGAMVHGFDTVGPRMWRARAGRLRAERWARRAIEAVRRGELTVGPESAAFVFARHEEPDGSLLPSRVAAVELLNIIRPTTALSHWVVFAALALHDHPSYRDRLREDGPLLDAFVQEVRRYYPFVPFLGARVRASFAWKGVPFVQGQRVILDVYGTLRDRRIWNDPDRFEPERFLGHEPTPFDFIPHGGGNFLGGHRCAGEWLSIEAVKQAVQLIARDLRYEVVAQDLSIDLGHVPALPRSGMVLARMRREQVSAPVLSPARIRGGNGASVQRV
jgi:fatty-acid peroxygenase